MAAPGPGERAYNGLDNAAQLGWRPGKPGMPSTTLPFGDKDHPAVVALRERLRAANGIVGLVRQSPPPPPPSFHLWDAAGRHNILHLSPLQEVVDGAAVLEGAPGVAERAAEIFLRDGFVAVENALVGADLARMQRASDTVVREAMALDPERLGNRNSHRYSFGGVSHSGHCMNVAEWVECLVDNEVCRRIMKHIFNSEDYICRGGGGDFCLPGCVEYQNLHQDMGDPIGSADPTDTPAVTIRDSPPPACTCNFAMQDLTFENGPIRQIPQTQHMRAPGGAFNAPPLETEPEWMRLSTVLVPAGSVVMRNVLCW